VRIDDLADPRFAPSVAAAMAAVEPIAAELTLDPDALCAAAGDAAGATTFGDDDFRERLDVLTDALRTETTLSPMGMVSTHGQLVGHLRNRILLESLLVEHPEILDVEITRPIVIVGQPRTGTTHLHNLMAADPGVALAALLGEPRAGAGARRAGRGRRR
jgi:hypothetical protein